MASVVGFVESHWDGWLDFVKLNCTVGNDQIVNCQIEDCVKIFVSNINSKWGYALMLEC